MKNSRKLNKIGIGVIGVGNRGKVTMHAHRPEDGVEILAGADLNETFLENFKKDLGGTPFITKDYLKLLDMPAINAIMICSPDFLHEEHAIAALNAGKDIFIEKPFSTTTESCDRIMMCAVRNNRRIYVGHNMRHMNFLQLLKKLVNSGVIGDVKAVWVRHFISRGGDCYFKDWHADRRKSNSLLVHKGVHDIDAIHWLCGSFTALTNAMGSLGVYNQIEDRDSNPELGKQDRSMDYWPPLSLKGINSVVDVEDLSMMQMRLENGILATYQQCHYTPDYWRNFTIIGAEGRLENFGSRSEETKICLFNHKTSYNASADQTYIVPKEITENSSPDQRVMQEFIAFLRDDSSVLTSVIAARQAVAAADFATRSLRQGGIPYEIPPLSAELLNYFHSYPKK